MSVANEGVVLITSAKDVFDPGAFLAKVGTGKSISKLQKGDIVFAQGDVADTVFYIQKGKIKVVVVSEEGKEAIVGILESGQFFGEGCLNGRQFRVATTVAHEASVVTRISKEAMARMLEVEPKFAEVFMMHLISRNSRIEEDLVDQLFNPSEKRLARVLLLLANFGKEAQPIDIDINQETLAEMIGSTRSRVSFFMNKFKRLGFISYNGTIKVHASLLNAILHDKSAIALEHEPDLCADSNGGSCSRERKASLHSPPAESTGK